jgi:hypothetical protein
VLEQWSNGSERSSRIIHYSITPLLHHPLF